jgi:hypothetical protein
MLPGSVEARAKIKITGLHSPLKSSDCVEPPLALDDVGDEPPDPPFGAAGAAAGAVVPLGAAGVAASPASCGCGTAVTAAIRAAKARSFILR